MSSFFEDWANESESNKKVCAQEDLIMNVTEDILVIMEDKGISKAELARKLSKSRSYVSQVLDGARNMTLRSLADICYALDIKPTVMINDAKTGLRLNAPVLHHDWRGSDSANVIYFPASARKRETVPVNGDNELKFA
ncbi:helix-turn-helix transcriptional regulator [Endozoicomonas sp. SCSIO W0465]|uniref:helix-turn-helix domain-containing protein n=1 Tax=Endozoicomonas sp. SCSIO W0465 TaxID=2918516 RepID=UPI002075BF8D|nr:helix-turn-helix transcriptional regulator [Endozoicomonas sp. SCSIO W0465]USE34103.1 helix-turn-helix transcriptional regulator [Endozoicomonas sp. SCSIO W0465]